MQRFMDLHICVAGSDVSLLLVSYVACSTTLVSTLLCFLSVATFTVATAQTGHAPLWHHNYSLPWGLRHAAVGTLVPTPQVC